jgi:hypothetical protein
MIEMVKGDRKQGFQRDCGAFFGGGGGQYCTKDRTATFELAFRL